MIPFINSFADHLELYLLLVAILDRLGFIFCFFGARALRLVNLIIQLFEFVIRVVLRDQSMMVHLMSRKDIKLAAVDMVESSAR